MQPQIMPPLKWAGGKRWLVPTLQQIYAQLPEPRLVEPFVGGMAVALGLQPKEALLNDANPHLINFFQQLQRGLVFDLTYGNEKSDFLSARNEFNRMIENSTATGPTAAKLFYYLIRTGYNGLCRFNRSGLFNVPFGRYKRIDYKKDLLKYIEYIKKWDFTCGDFANLAISESDFLYLDPPYDVQFTQYHTLGYSWDDQLRLSKWLVDKNNPMVISNQATDRILELYASGGFMVFTLEAPRMISCNGDRTKAKEVLALRNFSANTVNKVSKLLDRIN